MNNDAIEKIADFIILECADMYRRIALEKAERLLSNLERLGYRKIPDELPLLSAKDLFMNYYHDGTDPTQEGSDVRQFMQSSRAGQRAVKIAKAQRDKDMKTLRGE